MILHRKQARTCTLMVLFLSMILIYLQVPAMGCMAGVVGRNRPRCLGCKAGACAEEGPHLAGPERAQGCRCRSPYGMMGTACALLRDD